MPSLGVIGTTLKNVMEFLVPKFTNTDGSNTTLTDGQLLSIVNGKIITNGWRPSVSGDVDLLQEDGLANVGTSMVIAPLDHAHPSDPNKADKTNATFYGTTRVTNHVKTVSVIAIDEPKTLNLAMGIHYFIESVGMAVTLLLPEVTAANVGSEIVIKTLSLTTGNTGVLTFAKNATNAWLGDAPVTITENNARRILVASFFNDQYGWVSTV